MSAEPIEPFEAGREPEPVGYHSGIVNETCGWASGPTVDDIERCDRDATHTLVSYSGERYGIFQLAVCDEHGEPEEIAEDRMWSGEYVEG